MVRDVALKGVDDGTSIEKIGSDVWGRDVIPNSFEWMTCPLDELILPTVVATQPSFSQKDQSRTLENIRTNYSCRLRESGFSSRRRALLELRNRWTRMHSR